VPSLRGKSAPGPRAQWPVNQVVALEAGCRKVLVARHRTKAQGRVAPIAVVIERLGAPIWQRSSSHREVSIVVGSAGGRFADSDLALIA